jgi:hypothetical protein
VRREKLPRFVAGRRNALEAGDKFAFMRDDADARTEIGPVPVDAHIGSDLADIADRAAARRKEQSARPVEIVELRLVTAVAIKDLDAVVLAVGDVDPAVGVAADVVRKVELAGVDARFAPGEERARVRRVFVDPRIPVSVRDIEIVLGRNGGVRAAVKRLPAHIRGGFAGHTQREQHLSI